MHDEADVGVGVFHRLIDLDVSFRILGALQFAMMVITFRNMVKRG